MNEEGTRGGLLTGEGKAKASNGKSKKESLVSEQRTEE